MRVGGKWGRSLEWWWGFLDGWRCIPFYDCFSLYFRRFLALRNSNRLATLLAHDDTPRQQRRV